GCLQPLATPQRRARAEARVAEAARLWGAGRVRILPADAAPGWIAPEAAAFGLLHDDLTARLDPPATCRALLAACRARDVCYLPGTEVTALGDGGVHTASGFVPAGAVVVAAGTGSFRLITAPGLRSGGGVKGQAMLLGAAATGQPVIHADDIFIVAHDDGTVGLGSTTERDWTDPRATDAALDALHDRAVALCPALRGVPVLRRWAGLRPRAEGRQPMVGALPGRSGVAVCTGGYKIGFAIGHLAGAAAVAAALGERPELPESYAPARS
ncbi:MAG: FAD-binding oxidoreductase, partial [Alphaproteobacteria bacterium]